MKVILLQDVARLGRKYEIVAVPDGYALNKLIPTGLANSATPENIRRITSAHNKVNAAKEIKVDEFKSAIGTLKDKEIVIKTKVNDKGHLFEALKADQVVEALNAEGVGLDASLIQIKETVKTAGPQTITIVFGEVSANLAINIVSN